MTDDTKRMMDGIEIIVLSRGLLGCGKLLVVLASVVAVVFW